MENESVDSLTKKEQKELKQIEKQKEREKKIKVKKIKRIIPWMIGIGIFGTLGYWAVTAIEKNNASRPGEAVSVMGEEHISLEDPHVPYNSNPPTSGPHAGPAPWGFSAEEIPDENAIHNLEHGGIWISYKNLDDDSIALLGEISRRNGSSVIVSPREANDTTVAVASWGRLMKLDSVDEERINKFIRRNKNKSPEPLAI